ncbi:MAG: DUF2460 domain-containing protein [Candidatus Accumulibacter sp.]|uniref:DUF2460 domain-containing protein n=1 Tax=Accumulibacter sp. TaxID=2053492 RepID=UPI001AC70A02|nr:DUF2460 domain-containing protein [Accumulibacter sp.]MBN8518829.1 DUF2460 domain-containing protein [Accumulibacter sp.]MBO3712894.1 DUF2460 domain-containing protein [Accumulibacter sp.]MCM8622931.1 DUF2460 domain-containing protein [Accumulibacter sp.]
MPSFLEERLPVDVRLGMSYADDYTVMITTTSGGAEYRKLVQPFPARSFHINFTTDQADLWSRVIALYHRAYGKFAGFRVKCMDDFSTNNLTGTPTPLDEVLANSSTGIYQLRNFYGTNGTALAGVGYPSRTIFKPVAGTVVAAKNGVTISSGLTVNTTTGLITISPAPLISDTITAGCQFDIPCRFNSMIEVTAIDRKFRDCGSIDLIELLNP